MILTAATMKLEVLLGGAPATNQLPFACAWVDITSAAFTPGQTNGATSGVTPVDLIGAPAAATQRQAKSIDIFNADTAAVSVTVRLNDNGTMRVLATVTLDPGDTLEWHDSTGWQAIDSAGSRKASGGGGTGEANTASNAGTVGVGLVEPKSGVDLPFRSIGPASARVTVALDAVNHAVTVDSSPDADTVDGVHGTEILNARSTGLLTGGVMTIDGSYTTFSISDGAGLIVDNYTNTLSPVRTPVSWSGKVNLPVTYMASVDVTYVSINSAGAVVQKTTVPVMAEFRDSIFLGAIIHTSRSYISVITMSPFVAYDSLMQFNDLLMAIGPFNMGGDVFYPYGGSLQMGISAGVDFVIGSNYEADKKVPNVKVGAGGFPTTFVYTYRSAPATWAQGMPVTSVDPDQYDTGSGLGSVATNKFTLQTIFYDPRTGTSLIQYGQVVYDTMANVMANLRVGIELNPSATSLIFRGWVLVKQGATNLGDSAQAIVIPPGNTRIADLSVTNTFTGIMSINSKIGPEVTLDASEVPEAADKNYVTDDQAAALDSANLPSGANPVATMNDVPAIYDEIVEAASQVAETAAFAAGAKIVIRTDLL